MQVYDVVGLVKIVVVVGSDFPFSVAKAFLKVKAFLGLLKKLISVFMIIGFKIVYPSAVLHRCIKNKGSQSFILKKYINIGFGVCGALDQLYKII